MIPILSALLLCLSAQDDLAKARSFVQKLDSDDVQEREAAAQGLKILAPKSSEVDQFLEKTSREGNAEVRTRITSILEDRRLFQHAARFVSDPEEFLTRLRSSDRHARYFAWQRIRRFGAEGAPFAAEFLNAGDEFASEALRIVALSGDSRYVSKVRGLLQVPNLRFPALDALSRLGDVAIRPDLRELVTNPQSRRTDVIEWLGRFRHPEDIELFGRLVDDDQSVRSEVALASLRGWIQAQKELRETIFDQTRQEKGTAILLALDLRDPRLLGAIKNIDEQPEALFARTVLGDASVVPHLLRVAKYGPQPRLGLWGLGVLKARGGIEQLHRGRPKGPEPASEMKQILESLLEEYEVWDGQGSHVFRKRNSHAGDRGAETVMALWAFGEIGGAAAEYRAREALQDREEAVRYGACQALGRMRSIAAIPDLVQALDDALAFRPMASIPLPPKEGEDSSVAFSTVTRAQRDKGWAEVRQAAVQALEAITGERFEGTMDEKSAAWKAWATRRGDR
jgi:HEAT repeat protein